MQEDPSSFLLRMTIAFVILRGEKRNLQLRKDDLKSLLAVIDIFKLVARYFNHGLT